MLSGFRGWEEVKEDARWLWGIGFSPITDNPLRYGQGAKLRWRTLKETRKRRGPEKARKRPQSPAQRWFWEF